MPSPVRNHLCLIRLIPEANLALKPSSDLRLHEVSLELSSARKTRVTLPIQALTLAADSRTTCWPDNETRQGVERARRAWLRERTDTNGEQKRDKEADNDAIWPASRNFPRVLILTSASTRSRRAYLGWNKGLARLFRRPISFVLSPSTAFAPKRIVESRSLKERPSYWRRIDREGESGFPELAIRANKCIAKRGEKSW